MGASLKIYDIYISTASSIHYISAIKILEQIITGQFIESNKPAERALYVMIKYCIALQDTVIQSLENYVEKEHAQLLHEYLMKEEYDTESVLQDMESENMNISTDINSSQCIESIKMFIKLQEKGYIMALFQNMIKKMIDLYQKEKLWINKNELYTIQHTMLKDLMIGKGGFFNYYGIDMINVKYVRQFKWIIEGEKYTKFKQMKARKYIKSEDYKMILDDGEISFHINCCVEYTEEMQNCALFLYLDLLPSDVDSIRIEYDIMCKYNSSYRHHQISSQLLSTKENYKQYCGSQIFPSHIAKKTDAVQWLIGIKLLQCNRTRSSSVVHTNNETNIKQQQLQDNSDPFCTWHCPGACF
eukprot:320731_1